MKTIITVIKKELTNIFRDKRTLMTAIVLPAVAIPLLMMGITKLQKSIIQKENDKTASIAMINAPESMVKEFEAANFELIWDLDLDSAKARVSRENVDAVISFNKDFQNKVDELKSGELNLYYKSTNLLLDRKISKVIEVYKKKELDKRLKVLNISSASLNPVVVKKNDIATKKEQIGKLVGGFLPYIFIIFCFVGCMYPALDLITGEKEKKTLETLLTVPASRFKILFGKMLSIAIVGLLSAGFTITGMIVGLKLFPEIPSEFMQSIIGMINVKFILMLFAMLLPLSIFFAGGLSALVIKAKSFKEAQTYVTPLTFVVIIPAMIALMPGVELNWTTVWVPILNIALVTKEIMAETIAIEYYVVTVFSLVLLAVGAVYVGSKQFNRESMVLD